MTIYSAGSGTNEALCYLTYEIPYLGPEGGRPGSQAYMLRKLRNVFKFKIASHKHHLTLRKEHPLLMTIFTICIRYIVAV
jgi:hypothetical protein